MLPSLAAIGLSGAAAAVAAVAIVVVTLLLWHLSRPPLFASTALPPVLNRAVNWWLVMTLLFAFAALAWALLRRPLGLPRDGAFRYLPLAFGLMPLLVVNPIYLWRTAWVRRAIVHSRGRLCTHCAYDVSGLKPTGICPECGQPFDIDADAKLWSTLIARSTRDKR